MSTGLLSLLLVTTLSPAASAAPGSTSTPLATQSNGSDGGLFVYGSTGTLIDDPTYVFARAEQIYGSGGADHLMSPITGPSERVAGSTQTYTFIASQPTLRGGKYAWEAFSEGITTSGSAVAPTLTASSLTSGAGLAGVFSNVGGTYYLGIAFTKNNGVTVDSATYRTMHILEGNRYTLDAVEMNAPAAPASSPAESEMLAPLTEQPLEAKAAADAETSDLPEPTETFELQMPTGTTINLGEVERSSATEADTNAFTIIADKAEQPAWSLSMAASTFTSGSNEIDAIALGYTPTSSSPVPTGITLGQPKAPGSGEFGPIVSGETNARTGAAGVTLNLGLVFAPPADAAAGTYTSTVSFTLISG